MGNQMKLADVDVYQLVRALGMERSAWIDAAREEGRKTTDAEKVTICVLSALERALGSAATASDPGDELLAELAAAFGDKRET
jgi:hypothetical protein